MKAITKTEDCESFFNFFDPPQVPEDEDIDEETVSSTLHTDYTSQEKHNVFFLFFLYACMMNDSCTHLTG